MKVSSNVAFYMVNALAITSTQERIASAFTPSLSFTSHKRIRNGTTKSNSRHSPMNMLVPGHEHMIYDLDSLQTSMQSAHDILQMNLNFHSSMLLSDAAAAVADTAEAVTDTATEAAKEGWWQSYLGVFKSGLVFVHSQIDGPLRNMGFTETWGPSIILFTFGVRSLVLPLSIQQAKSTEYTKALKPYMNDIKEKFKDNKDMLNRATAKLYEDAGTNPLNGCLISLSQIPIFLGLYRSITLLAKDGAIDESFLWIPSLQGPVTAPNYRGMEWLTEGWTFDGNFPVPHLGWETTLAFIAMPVILVCQQFFNLNALQPETDTDSMSDEEREQFEKSQGILKFLPLLIGYFSIQVPAGLTLYWFTSNFFTLSQSLAARSYYAANPPQIELPDYWDALDNVSEMSPEEKRKAAEAGIPTGPTFDDLLDEAKFHYVVDRKPLREQSAAWERVQAGEGNIPTVFAAWADGATSLKKEEIKPLSKQANETVSLEPANVD